MEKEKYLKGVWTPWAQVLCYECHGNEKLPQPKTAEEWERIIQPAALKYGNAVTTCDSCGAAIQLDRSVALEHELVKALRERGFEAAMQQTGGMHSCCRIAVSKEVYGKGGEDVPYEVYVTYDFDGDGLYWTGANDDQGCVADVDWGQQSFQTQDEALSWVYSNQEKFAKLDHPGLQKSPAQETTLAALVNQAKERAQAENTAGQEEKKPPGTHEPER